MRILLIDDDDRLRVLVAEVLSEAGFVVTQSAEPECILDAIRNGNRPDVLITDVDLNASTNGFALVKAARSRWPLLPVVVISGVTENITGCCPEKISRFLQKPFSCSDLLRDVRDLIGSRANPELA